MADNRTGLSATDLAEQFRDVCGDGSMEWVYTPMQTWLLLDAADMLDENARLRSCLTDAAENARLIMGENAELRELVRDMFRDFANADYELKRYQGRTFMAVTRYVPRMRELGVEP